MASLLLDPPWDRAVGVTDCQETLWLSVHILEALQVPFPGHVGPWGVTEEQVVGGEGRLQVQQQQSEAVTQQSLGCSAQEKVEAEAILCTALSQGERGGAEGSTTGRERSQAR